MYHCHNENSHRFNAIHESIAVNESLSSIVITDLWNYAAYHKETRRYSEKQIIFL